MSDSTAMAALATLMTLLAALPLAVAAALALTMLAWRWPRWLRRCLSVMALAAACVPALALSWSFIGLWLGALRWPVESLMPTPGGGGWSAFVWAWAPAVFLAAAAPAFALLSFLLATVQPWPANGRAREMKPPRWFDRHELPRLLALLRPRLIWLTLLAALGLILVEDALRLRGLGASLAAAVRRENAGDLGWHAAGLLIIVALVTLVWRILLRGGAPASPVNNRCNAVVEGAVAAGLSRRQAWLRHALPTELRRGLAIVLTAAAWIWLAWVQLAAMTGREPGTALAAVCETALDDPAAPLRAAAWPALWVLSLLLLGRIVAPRTHAPSSWPTHLTPPAPRSSGSAT